jgi:hypothetical protein
MFLISGKDIAEERSNGNLKKVLTLLLIASLFVLPGCYKRPASPPPQEKAINDVRIYFPAEQSLTWIYEGSGNEYAAFTRKVIYKEDRRVQLAQDNGGTRLGMVLQVLPEAVSVNYVREEFYTDTKLFSEAANRSEILLKAPLKAGAVWETGRERREVISIDETVQVPAGTYSNVVKVKVTSLTANTASENVEYYAPNVGLVLQQFITGSDKIESQLRR